MGRLRSPNGLPSGGWHREIEPKWLEKLREVVPAYPPHWFVHAVSTFADNRATPEATMGEARGALEKIQKQADDLLLGLTGLNDTASDLITIHAVKAGDDPACLRMFRDALYRFGIAAEMARREAEEKTAANRPGATTLLITDLVRGMRMIDPEYTPAAKAPLTQLFVLALKAAGITADPTNPHATVASALKQLKE